MVQVSGPLKIMTDKPSRVSEVWVGSPQTRPHGGGLLLEERDKVTPVGGVLSFTSVPGPVLLTLVSGGRVVDSVKGIVPDQANATLAEVVRAVGLADAGTLTALEELALEVAADAARVGTAAQVGAWADQASSAASAASGSASAASTSASTATTAANSVPGRVSTEIDSQLPPKIDQLVPPKVAEVIGSDTVVRDAAAAAAENAVSVVLPDLPMARGSLPVGIDLNNVKGKSMAGPWVLLFSRRPGTLNLPPDFPSSSGTFVLDWSHDGSQTQTITGNGGLSWTRFWNSASWSSWKPGFTSVSLVEGRKGRVQESMATYTGAEANGAKALYAIDAKSGRYDTPPGFPNGPSGVVLTISPDDAAEAQMIISTNGEFMAVRGGGGSMGEWVPVRTGKVPMDVVIVAGQSNALVQNTNLVSGSRVWEQDDRIKFWRNSAILQPYGGWVDDVAKGIARGLRREHPERAVLIVPVSQGDTGFRTTSIRPAPGGLRETTGTWDRNLDDPNNLAIQLIAEVQAAITAVEVKGWGLGRVIMTWSQGEADTALSTAEYATRLDDLITWIRGQLSIPDLPVVVTQMVPEWESESPARKGIGQAHRMTPARLQRTAFQPGPRSRQNFGAAEAIHYSAPGRVSLGESAATSGLRRALRNLDGVGPEAPHNLTANRVGDQVEWQWTAPECRATSFTLETSTDQVAWTPQSLDFPLALSHSVTSADPIWGRLTTTNTLGTSHPSSPAGA